MGVIRDWIIEFEGKAIGRFRNGSSVEMFWDEYEFVPIEGAPKNVMCLLMDPTKWLDFEFRDPKTGQTSTAATGLIDETTEKKLADSKIVLRGLYTPSDIEESKQPAKWTLAERLLVTLGTVLLLAGFLVMVYCFQLGLNWMQGR